jgi:signal transduction histidine kinase
VNDSSVPALRSTEVTDLATLSTDATAVGTAQGVTFLYADSAFRSGIRLAHSVTDADGLPHASVVTRGPLDAARRLWVGTTLGLGFINTAEVERPRVPVRITDLEMRDVRGESVALVRRFTVERPWWRSPTAGPVYLALAGAGVFGWVRSRTQAARRRALEAEENERRVAVSESRFRRLFEDGTDPQILVLDGSIWQLNAAADTLLTHDGVDLRSQPVDSVIDGLTARLNGDASTGRWDLEARGPAGPIPVEVRRTRIPLDGAVLDHLELSDLREQRRLEAERAELEAQLREAQRLESVGTLAGGVAHDFNNLLTVIHTNAELAAADVPAASAAGESLTQLLVASRRAREVVRQILTFSRRTRTHRSAVRIEALLTETQSLLRAMIPSTVQIVFRDDAPGAVVEGDATQLQQLLLNLCSNAEYAMRATNGGTLTVQARWEDHAPATAVRLSVTDTGVGIPADVRARMFEPFFTTKPVGEGTGLGLSVLHGIVGAHGGTITVTSDLGRGSMFDVVLPAHHADQAASQEPPVVTPVAAATRRILLVDDEPAVMKAVQRTLQRRGYEVETASNGEQRRATASNGEQRRATAPRRWSGCGRATGSIA